MKLIATALLTMLTFPIVAIATSVMGPRDIEFEPGRPTHENLKVGFRLPADQKANFNDVAAVLKANPSLRLEVVGHTDNRECATNEKSAEHDPTDRRRATLISCSALGYMRANWVFEQLISAGVNKDQLAEPRSFGEYQPIDTNENTAGRAKNRRVQFTPAEDGIGR